MLVPISEITVNPGRREAAPGDVKELADSILEVGLINPIMVDQAHTLIAGLHRLEAMKLLGRTEIECTVSDLDGLQVELAEIDENFVRKDLSDDEFREMLLRRKEIYESLHPETKATYDGGAFRGNQHQNVVDENFSATTKSFVQDTADKLGVSPRTVELQIQTAKNLTPEAKEIIKGTKITKKDALKLSRLEPERQKDAASQLAAGEIKSMSEYHPAPAEEPPSPEPPASPPVPYSLGDKHYASIEESVADLKNPDKDCSYTPDTLLADIDGFVDTFHKNFAWYNDPFCTVVFPSLSPVQFNFVRQRFATIFSAMEDLLNLMERTMNK